VPRRKFTVSLADLERYSLDALPPEARPCKVDRPCCIHFHSQRHRLTDLDGLCGKYVLDALVSAGVLQDDRIQFVTEISHSQEKIPTSQPEMTTVSFYYTDTGETQ
jgi:hypothetical protein